MSWLFFQRYFFSKRSSSLVRRVARIALSAIVVGVAAWIVVLSVMNGFHGVIGRRLYQIEPHLVFKSPLSRGQLLAFMSDEASKEGFSLSETVEQDVIVRTMDGHFGGGVLRGQFSGSVAEFLSRLRKLDSLREIGESTTPKSESLDVGQIYLGVDLARGLGIFEGDVVQLITPDTLVLPKGEAPPVQSVTVKGLIFSRMPDIDRQMILFDPELSLKPWRRSQVASRYWEVRLADPFRADKLKSNLFNQGVSSQTWMDRNQPLFFSLRLEGWAMGTFLGTAAMITCLSIVAVMILLFQTKQSEMGLLMALGLSPVKVDRLFGALGLGIGLLGIGGGVALGTGISLWIQAHPLELLPDIYYDAEIPAKVEFMQILLITAFCGLLSFLTAFIPMILFKGRTPSQLIRRTA